MHNFSFILFILGESESYLYVILQGNVVIVEEISEIERNSTNNLNIENNIPNIRTKQSFKFSTKTVTKLDLTKINLKINTGCNKNEIKVNGTKSPINRIAGRVSPINSPDILSPQNYHKFMTIRASPIPLDIQGVRKLESPKNFEDMIKSERNYTTIQNENGPKFKPKFKLSKGNYFGDIALIKDNLR